MIVSLSLFSIGQVDYYITDSIGVFGVKIIDQGDILNSRICIVIDKKETLEFTPYQLTEYRTNNKIYVSKEIEINGESRRVFLKRLLRDSTSLYYYRAKGVKKFYFQKDDQELKALPRRKTTNGKITYKEILHNHTEDCSYTTDFARFIRYNKRDLTSLFRNYNECTPAQFSVRKYGLMAGFGNFITFIPKNDKTQLKDVFNFYHKPQSSVSFFVDNPVYGDVLSLFIAISLSQRADSYIARFRDTDLDLVMNSLNLQIPVLLRYRITTAKFNPFLSAGAILGYDLQNETYIYQAHFNQDVITIEKTPYVIPDINFFAGFSAGAGIEYKHNIRNVISFELRYSFLQPLGESKSNNLLLGNSGYQMLTAISF